MKVKKSQQQPRFIPGTYVVRKIDPDIPLRVLDQCEGIVTFQRVSDPMYQEIVAASELKPIWFSTHVAG